MAVNYNDKRFTEVKNQENQALKSANNMYNNMINNSDNYYEDMIQASEDYGKTQQDIQQANTDFAIEKIEQQKDQAAKDYTKEQKGAYVDWQKQSNQYGVNAEQIASMGLSNSGYSESSQVNMYNTYQNRIGQARDTYQRAVLEYDNGIKEAQLSNNAKLAEIAYQALSTKLELGLNQFQYKNNLLQQQLATQNELKNTYYQRWQNVLSQINTENSLKEQQRQFNEQLKEEQRQFNEQMALQKKKLSSGSSGGSSKSNTSNAKGGSNNPKITGNNTSTNTNEKSEQKLQSTKKSVSALIMTMNAASGRKYSNAKNWVKQNIDGKVFTVTELQNKLAYAQKNKILSDDMIGMIMTQYGLKKNGTKITTSKSGSGKKG